MSERENPHDSQTAANSAWSQSGVSNRPAQGAARADSLQGVEGTWQSSEGATDFLGLEADGNSAPPGGAPSGAARPESGGTQDWLFHMEHASAVEVQSATGVGELEAPADAPFAAQETLLAEAPPEALTEAGGALASGTSPLGVDTLLDEVLPETAEGDPLAAGSEGAAGTEQVQRGPRGRRVQWMVAAGLLLALGGAAGWQLWQRRKHGSSSEPNQTVVVRPHDGAAKPPTQPGSAVAHGTKPTTPVPPGPKPLVPSDSIERPETVAGTPPTTEPARPTGTDEQPTTPESDPTALLAETPPLEAGSNPPLGAGEGGAPLGFAPNGIGAQPNVVALPPLVTPKGARRPERAELGNTWSSNTIPFDAIDDERQLVTPRVGAVRVLLKNGEHLQGHLHSVGQGHLSVDIALGRMKVDYRDVHELLQIQEADLTKKPTGGLPEETAGLPYVCARVPNGTITGWLVSQDKGKLTLITETAKKLTIDDEGYEPVSKGRSRILGALAKNASSPK